MAGVFSFLCFSLGIPLALSNVPPNRWYGYRTNIYVFEDEEIWYEVDAGGGKHLIFGGYIFGIMTFVSSLYIGNAAVQNILTPVTAALALPGIIATASGAIRFSLGLAKDKGLIQSNGGEPGDRD